MTDKEIKELIDFAVSAAENSYSPYSGFSVGAALKGADGRIFCGVNVENISFGGTICAERSALCRAVTDGVKNFEALAVYHKGSFAYPCGICRQMLSEFGDMDVYISDGKTYIKKRLGDLMPYNFESKEIT